MRHKKKLAALGAIVIAGALVFRTFLASPLPAPAALDGPIPSASPPPSMHLARIVTGVTHRSAAVAYRGGSFLAGEPSHKHNKLIARCAHLPLVAFFENEAGGSIRITRLHLHETDRGAVLPTCDEIVMREVLWQLRVWDSAFG